MNKILPNDYPRPIQDYQLTHEGHFVAGAVTNAVAMFSLQPLFVCKSWSQHGFSGIPPISRWGKGVLPNCCSGAPLEAIGFAVESFAKSHFPGPKTDLEQFQISLVAGFLGAPTTTVIERPMLVSHMTGKSTKEAILTILEKEGVRGFFKGNIPTIGREVGYHIGLFACADVIAKHLRPLIQDESTREKTASVVSGSCIGIFTNPFDRIKALMQGNVENKHTSFTKTVQYIWQESGPQGFFKGVLWRTSAMAAAVLVVRESKQIFVAIAPESLVEKKKA